MKNVMKKHGLEIKHEIIPLFSSVMNILVYISQTSYHKFTIQNGVLLWRHLQQDHMPHITSYYHNAFPYLQSCRWCFIRQVFNINVHIQHFFNNLLEFDSLYSSQILLHLIEWKNDITDIVMVPLIL